MRIVQNRFVQPALLAAVAGLSASALADPTYSTIALTGVSNQYGPGMGSAIFSGDQYFNGTPSINNSGNVAFNASVSGAPAAAGMWIYGGGQNYNVALAGGVRPGGGTYTTGSVNVFNSTSVNDSGEWFLRLGASAGVFGSSGGGVPGRYALSGDVAPGTGGATFATSAVATGTPYYNNAGQAAFIGNLTSGTGSPVVTFTSPINNSAGVWIGTPGATSLVLRQNETSTLLDNGQAAGESRVGSFQTGSMGFNNNGSYVVSSNLQGANIITATSNAGQNNGVILSNRSGSLEVIARAGTAAPDANGAPSSDLWRGTTSGGITSSGIAINNAGHVAFVATLRNSGTTQTASSALFTDTNGTLHLVGRNTGAMPTIYTTSGAVNTTYTGASWSSFSNPILNAQSTLGFIASTTSASAANAVITMDTAGRMTSIAQTGQVAVVGGAPLGGDALFNSFSSIQMNGVGQMVFSSLLINGNGIFGGPGGNNSILMGWDPVAGLMQIARTGDSFTVAPGDVRTISSIGGNTTTGGQDGRNIGLNNSGQFALMLSFTDGSAGIFVATIPTPSAAALLGLSALAGFRRRR